MIDRDMTFLCQGKYNHPLIFFGITKTNYFFVCLNDQSVVMKSLLLCVRDYTKQNLYLSYKPNALMKI